MTTPVVDGVVYSTLKTDSRLDAVQDLLDHPSFEEEFTGVTKGLPDLERIVSRIHAKSCKVKDFLKVLQVGSHTYFNRQPWIIPSLLGFPKVE